MSGDQVLNKPFEILVKPEDKKEIKPNNFMVTVNGLPFQSNLNPNALEFVPSYLQNKPQIKLNKELRKFVLKEVVDAKQNQDNTKIKNELNITEVNEKEEHLGKILESIVYNNNDSVNTKEASKNEIADIEKSTNVNENKDTKENLEINKEQLYMLFASPSKFIHTSSETEVSLKPDNVYENSVRDNYEEKAEILDLCYNVVDIILCDFLEERNETKTYNDLFIQKHFLENINVNHVSKVKNKNELVEDGNTNLLENTNDNTELIYQINSDNIELCEQTNTSVSNVNKNKKNDDQILCSSDDQQKVNTNIKISKEEKVYKGQSNVNSKITTLQPPKTGAIKKTNLSKKCENQIKDPKKLNTVIEPKKDIRLKATISIVQNPKSDKSSLKSSITQKHLIAKNHILSTNKLEVKPFRKEVSHIFKKDAISNRSTSSTDKSLSSTRSSTLSGKIKSTEKPLVLGSKAKECVIKSARATVSSKLRKTETQKVS